MPEQQNTTSTIGLYRSGITSAEQLQHVTVGRQHYINEMRQKLLGSMGKAEKQHSMFIGPRGVGKTHLLTLIEQEVHDNPKLEKHYTIVRFPEESLRLLSYVDFLLGVCDILQDVLPPQEAGRWSRLYNQLVEDADDNRVRDLIETEIKQLVKGRKHSLLIMIENFDEVLTRQIKAQKDAAALRKFFMGDNGCVLIATAPLYFSAITDVQQPFYDFFDVQTINTLTAEETLSLIKQNLTWEDRQELLDTFADLKPRILSLYQMTDGNPRLTMMLYELIAHDSIIAARDQFMRLLDRITPFYQDRIKDIPPQERAILETMARIRNKPKTPTLLAARMRMSKQQTSTLLKRLVDSYYVKSIPNPADKRSRIYTIREGFFDLWLAMNLSRSDRMRLPFLVDFFELWYRSLDEREEKRKALNELLKQTERHEEALLGLDHLSEVGTPDERVTSKIRLAKTLQALGHSEKATSYIHELQRVELDGLGKWVTDHAPEWQGQCPDFYSELESMINCWQQQRSGNLEAFASMLTEMGTGLNFKNFNKARIGFLTESLRHLDDPEQQIALRLMIARTLQIFCRWDEAEDLFRQAEEQAQKLNSPQIVAIVLNDLALLLQDTGRLKEAQPVIRKALKITEELYGPDHFESAILLSNLASLLQVTGHTQEAETLLRKAVNITETGVGEDDPRLAAKLNNLALLLKELGRFTEAEFHMRRALRITQSSYGHPHPNIGTSLNNLAQLLHAMGRDEEAEPLIREALKIDEECLASNHPNIASSLNNLALLLFATGRFAEAEQFIVRALNICDESLGKDHPHYIVTRNNLEVLQGFKEEATLSSL